VQNCNPRQSPIGETGSGRAAPSGKTAAPKGTKSIEFTGEGYAGLQFYSLSGGVLGKWPEPMHRQCFSNANGIGAWKFVPL